MLLCMLVEVCLCVCECVCVCVCVCVCGQSSKHTASNTLTPHMSGGFTVSKKLRKL
jgi:hypothetical protein